MKKRWLEAELGKGKSFEQIGREIDRDSSTVAYWARKHGLESSRAAASARRGEPDRGLVEELCERGATLSEIAAAVDRSISTVRYWLRKWGVGRADARRTRCDPATAPRVVERLCPEHGRTDFVLESRGYYRCRQCRQQRVSEWRRRVKSRLVVEAGGRCVRCGYDRCAAALHFHHLDPGQKAFALFRQGVTRSFAEARAEAAKCVLLCANCHAEVESGLANLSRADAA